MNRRYLTYVLLHKWYVFKAGIALRGWSPRWVWRLLVHDLSKFSRAEWRPYVEMFYGHKSDDETVMQQRDRAFKAAWLHHLHHNPHHWQHWILNQDDGRQFVLLMPVDLVDEMVADWCGAGQKVWKRPTLRRAVAETIQWYEDNAAIMKLRAPVRLRVEAQLVQLAARVGIIGPDGPIELRTNVQMIEVATR